MTPNTETTYRDRYFTILSPLAANLESHLRDQLSGVPRIDRVCVRAKTPIRFLEKAQKVRGGVPKYSDPLNQIQDQVGARIVVYFEQDVATVSNQIDKLYHRFEKRALVPDTEWEFGYFGVHYILALPNDVIPSNIPIDCGLECFELQVKTLWQHAWSEANHDLGYKPAEELKPEFRRMLAYTSAQAWGADRIFAELFAECALKHGKDYA